ncbi:MAG: glycoside hydrolase, partial [Paraprevotella sp.]|nr:glycoside hydrolase [Paraprevotella sp.]
FKDVDVLNVDEDDDNYRGVMSICCGDKNRVRNVLFENIRVEDCEEARLIDIRVLFNEKYNTVPGGTIENIVFRNIDYKTEGGDMYPMRIKGYDEKSVVRGILFENVVLNGARMESTVGIEMNAHVDDVQVK